VKHPCSNRATQGDKGLKYCGTIYRGAITILKVKVLVVGVSSKIYEVQE